ncbi:MAG: hypothetical protein ACM3TR_14655 [Caulobacteraceae bacterium]
MYYYLVPGIFLVLAAVYYFFAVFSKDKELISKLNRRAALTGWEIKSKDDILHFLEGYIY